MRDSAWIRAQSFPVFAAGVTHRGPYKDGPGEINVPVSIGGMVIEPGDLMVGDDDGLVAIPFLEAETIYELAAEKHQSEISAFADIGKSDNNAEGYRKKLLALGCTFEE